MVHAAWLGPYHVAVVEKRDFHVRKNLLSIKKLPRVLENSGFPAHAMPTIITRIGQVIDLYYENVVVSCEFSQPRLTFKNNNVQQKLERITIDCF